MKTLPLRYAAEVRVSNVDKKSLEGQVPVRLCNYTDVYYADVIRDDRDFMPATATSEQVARFRLRVGDTIITKDSETAEDIAVPSYVEEEAADLVCGYHLAILRPRASVDPRFLSWAVASDYCKEQFTVEATGVTRFGLKYEAILGVDVPMPEIGEQRRIADYLDEQVARIDDVIRLREEQVVALECWRISTLAEKLDALGTEFGFVPLKRFMKGIEQGWSPVCENRPSDVGGYGVLKLGAVRDGDFRELENKALPEGVEPAWSYRVRSGDLLVSRANTPALVGEAAVVPPGIPSNLFLPDLLYRLTLRINEAEFISAALATPRVRGEVGVIARGTSQTMVKLRGEDIGALHIPAAPENERRALSDTSHEIRQLRTNASAEMKSQILVLQERKSSLITAAVTGKLDVTTAGAA